MDIGRNLYTLGELGDTGGDVTEHDLKKRSFGLGLLGGGWILRALEFGPFEIWELISSRYPYLSRDSTARQYATESTYAVGKVKTVIGAVVDVSLHSFVYLPITLD